MPNNKVIIIDDDPSVLKGLARVLKLAGFNPVVFDCAESFQNERDVGEACCMVIDIHLKGKSGLELKQTIGNLLPVIFITASDNEAVAVAAREAGCIAFLRKPFPAQSLIDPIRQLSKGHQAHVIEN